MPTTIIPYLGPLEIYEKGFTPQAQYNSKHLNDVPFEQQIYLWQQKVKYSQPWQLNDTIRLQFRSELGPVSWKLYAKETGVLIDTDNFDQVLQNADNPDEYIYQAAIALSSYEEGCYYFEFDFGGLLPLFSEDLIFSNVFENSLLLQCANSSFKGDTIFETGFFFTIRILGLLKYKQPGSKDVVYEDQVLNETMIDSKPYDLYELQLSDELGIPDGKVRSLNEALGCDTLIIDGRYYVKNEGAKLEPLEQGRYPMRGWKVEMREQLNRRGRYFSTEGSTDQGVVIIANTDAKGFIEEGADDGTGSIYQIKQVL